jgi:hypothetical protein
MGFISRRIRRASRLGIALLAVAGSLAVLGASVLISHLTRSVASAICISAPPQEGADPLPDGTRTTVGHAQSVAGFPVLVPHGQASKAQVWVTNYAVALSYGGGKITITMTIASYSDPLAWFKTFIAENHVAAGIGQVNGQPALVISPDTSECGGNPAVVEFDYQGVDIEISSHAYGTATLLTVADSMRPAVPWHPTRLPPRLRGPAG